MAKAGEPDSPSRLASSKFTPFTNTSPSTKMYDVPAELTPAQLEAKTILSHLLHKLKDPESKYYPRYGKWIERHPRLGDFCFRCVRPQVWTFLNGRWSLDGLKTVGGDLRHEGRGIYFNGVLGLDKKVRMYVGQANSIRPRIAQHLNFRYRRDNPSLHYHAMQQSIYNSIGVAAILPSPSMGNHALPGMDHSDLLLNVLEMWMCLVFRTLPLQTLEAWLPDDESISKSREEGREGEFGGLNIASPIDHGEKEREWPDLSECDDPLVRDYLGLGRKLSETEQRQRNDAKHVKVEPKVEEAVEEDTPALRRKTYTERSRSYNKYMNIRDAEPSQALGFVFAFGIGIAIGAALLRTGGVGRVR